MTAQKPPSGPCALIAPGNWNASGWVPTCRLSAGHEGDHVEVEPTDTPGLWVYKVRDACRSRSVEPTDAAAGPAADGRYESGDGRG